jgi:hypothetical protein
MAGVALQDNGNHQYRTMWQLLKQVRHLMETVSRKHVQAKV